MGRPAVHTAEAIIEAAIELFAAGGAQAVTMTSVAKLIGAPSGSVYHRFPDRPSLLAQMWLETTGAFEAGFREALGQNPSPESAVDAAAWVADWCRATPGAASLLHAGRRTLQPEAWPRTAVDSLAEQQADRDQAMARAVRAIAERAGRPRDEVTFAMVDLPLAVVRPHLSAGEPVPASATARVRRLATRILMTRCT